MNGSSNSKNKFPQFNQSSPLMTIISQTSTQSKKKNIDNAMLIVIDASSTTFTKEESTKY
jgi:hypothetical protein